MVPVICRTNLDNLNMHHFPIDLPERPVVGDLIQSPVVSGYDRNKKLILKVVRTTWVVNNYQWALEVELHLPDHFRNVLHFEDWHNKWFRGMETNYEGSTRDRGLDIRN